MKYISAKKEDMSLYGKKAKGVVYSAHVIIEDIEGRASDMIETFSNNSWIDKLEAVEKVSFKARSKRTIEKLVGLIKSRAENEVTTEFGEILISESAQSTLKNQFKHVKVPLADFLKEKITGNPGFDFHTESKTNLISFGEAKYSGKESRHFKALEQIVDFIELEKDSAELSDIKYFVTEIASENAVNGMRAYVAAFSINAKDPNKIFNNALKSKEMDALLCFPEIYLIGIEIDAK